MIGKPTRGVAVDRDLVVKLYRSGLSMLEIGRRTGHCHGVIAYHLYKSGTPIRKTRLVKPQVSTEEIISLYNSGWSMPQISEKVNITSQSIFQRLVKNGITIRKIGEALKNGYETGRIKKKIGENHPSWKGGIYKTKDGYVEIAIGNNRRKPEHRIVWEKQNGNIKKGYVIHHLNGKRDDNRIENLVAIPRKRHSPSTIIEPHQKRIRQLESKLNRLITIEKK